MTTKFILFLDIDGTLAELQAHPNDAFIPFTTLRLLQQLQHYCTLFLITGRCIQDTSHLLPSNHFNIIGSHGAEIQYADQHAAQPLLAINHSAIQTLYDYVKQQHTAWQPVWIELKPYSIAFHYRQHPEAATLAKIAASACIEQCPEFMLKAGKCVYEVVLKGIHKGAAIEKICSSHTQHMPIFIGDDVTDEDGFQMVNQLNGCSIKVGAEPTKALFQVNNVTEVAALLQQFLSQFKLYTAPMEGESICPDSLSYPTG